MQPISKEGICCAAENAWPIAQLFQRWTPACIPGQIRDVLLTIDERPSTLPKAGHYSVFTVFRVHLRRLIRHTHGPVNLLDCEDSFLRRIHPFSELQELRLCDRNSLDRLNADWWPQRPGALNAARP